MILDKSVLIPSGTISHLSKDGKYYTFCPENRFRSPIVQPLLSFNMSAELRGRANGHVFCCFLGLLSDLSLASVLGFT